ncbi:TPA: hypothetical protein QCY70_004939 [Bacillus cereus]|uniref:hypothetical protein n=1 Tax=Bacillus cereus group TaxID=86661 RepID=UPI0032F2199D|nr:hypothetical protein [Bacillus cereus]HDR8014971.1 hypothetical protein [Bacillus cereus]
MDYLERAEALFNRYVGRKVKAERYSEQLRYDGAMGAKLSQTPVVRIVSVKAKTSNWDYNDFFGDTKYIDIDLDQVSLEAKGEATHITLPPTMFGTDYSDVEVEYIAGLEEIPQDVTAAIKEIASLLRTGQITEWNCILPVSIIDVIDKYRKEEI